MVKGLAGGAVSDAKIANKGLAAGGEGTVMAAEDIGKGVAKPFEMLGGLIFKNPAQSKTATMMPGQTKPIRGTLPASIIPHASPTAGASSLSDRVKTPTKAPAGSGGTGGTSGTGSGGTGGRVALGVPVCRLPRSLARPTSTPC